MADIMDPPLRSSRSIAWRPARSLWSTDSENQLDDPPRGGHGAGTLGTGLISLGDTDGFNDSVLTGRIVVLTTSVDDNGASRAAWLRRELYSLCDAVVRPFCAATHRPYPLVELRRAREAGSPLPVRHKRLSDALVDAGHVVLCAEDSFAGAHDALPGGLDSLLDRVLSCRPAAVLICSDRDVAASPIYGAHARYVEDRLLPLVTISSRMGWARGGGSLEHVLRTFAGPLAGGRGWLQLGLQRAVNTAADYDLVLQHGVAAVEFLHLLGVWRHALTGREVSPLEHLHDHCDQMTSQQWDKERQGLHVVLSLDVLGETFAAAPQRRQAEGLGPQGQPGPLHWQPFGCQLQDLGGVLTYLGRTGVCRILHLISADRGGKDDPAASTFFAHLIYKLALLREEYSES